VVTSGTIDRRMLWARHSRVQRSVLKRSWFA
jgi:hypothetical protein